MRAERVAVRDYLTEKIKGVARLRGELNLIEKENGITAPDWKTLDIYVDKSNQYPFISILPERSVNVYEQGNYELRSTDTVKILVGMNGLDHRLVIDGLDAYGEAISRIIARDISLANSKDVPRVLRAWVERMDYSDIVKSQQSGDFYQHLLIETTIQSLPKIATQTITL